MSLNVEPGHILAVSQRGEVVRDKYGKGGLGASAGLSRGKKVQLPHERVGVVMVFKAFDKMSYALVMETTHEIVYPTGGVRNITRRAYTR